MKGVLSKRNILFLLVAFTVIWAGRVYSFFPNNNQYETFEVKKTSLSQRVTANGEIKSNDEVELKFPTSGKLVHLAVEKNDRVRKWQYLGSLDKEQLQKEMIKSLRDYSKERNDFEEDRLLTYKDKVFTDTIKRILEKNQFDLDKAVLDVEIANFAMKNAGIVSPIDGVVTKVHTHEGTSITSTTPIVTVADPDNVFFIARVGESDIAEVAVGQEAYLALDAFADKKIKGRVTEIDYAATVTNGSKSYLVKIVFEETSGVKLDMSGEAEIQTLLKQEVLAVPKIAVKEKSNAGERKKYVETFTPKEIKKKEVVTGLKGTGGIVEIVSGLSEGEEVIISRQK